MPTSELNGFPCRACSGMRLPWQAQAWDCRGVLRHGIAAPRFALAAAPNFLALITGKVVSSWHVVVTTSLARAWREPDAGSVRIFLAAPCLMGVRSRPSLQGDREREHEPGGPETGSSRICFAAPCLMGAQPCPSLQGD